MEKIIIMQQSQGLEGILFTLLPLLAIFVIFYFFIIRPERKRQRDFQNFLENIKRGDKVITIGGIEGRVVGITNNHFIIESEGTRFKVLKKAISMEYTRNLHKEEEKETKEPNKTDKKN